MEQRDANFKSVSNATGWMIQEPSQELGTSRCRLLCSVQVQSCPGRPNDIFKVLTCCVTKPSRMHRLCQRKLLDDVCFVIQYTGLLFQKYHSLRFMR